MATISRDLEAGASYISLSDSPVVRTEKLDDTVMVDRGLDGSVVGIEILALVQFPSRSAH